MKTESETEERREKDATHSLTYALRAIVSRRCFGPYKTDFEIKKPTVLQCNELLTLAYFAK